MFSSCWSSLTSDCRSWSKIGILGCSRGEKRTITIVDSKLSFCSRYQLSPFNRKFQVVVHSTCNTWLVQHQLFCVIEGLKGIGNSFQARYVLWSILAKVVDAVQDPGHLEELLDYWRCLIVFKTTSPSQAHLCIGDWSTSWPDLVSESSVFSSHQPSLNCLVPELLVSWLILRSGHVATFPWQKSPQSKFVLERPSHAVPIKCTFMDRS